MSSVLIVDDLLSIHEMLEAVIQPTGFITAFATDGEKALARYKVERFDLVLADIDMKPMDGITLLKQLKAYDPSAVIIIMTAYASTESAIQALKFGAFDYMQKPFRDKAELIARIRTRLRRTNADVTGLLTIADLTIDVTAHEVQRGSTLIQLTRLEFDLLVALARDPGRVFTRDALLSEVWGYRHSTDTRLVNVHVQRLRSKIEHDPEHPEIVMTVRGVGYKAGSPA